MLTKVQYNESTDDYFIEFPEEMMEELGWRPGDILHWIDNEDGSFTIRKPDSENHH